MAIFDNFIIKMLGHPPIRSKQCLIVLRKERNGIFFVLSHRKEIAEPKFNTHLGILKLILKIVLTKIYN